MYTTYHLKSVSELNEDIEESIKLAFKGKSITITVQEDLVDKHDIIPNWHLKLALEEKQILDQGKTEFYDWNKIKIFF